MDRNDIQVWVRFYLYDGKSVDVDFEPLSYRSHSEYVDAFEEHWIEYSNKDQDYDIVDWDYLDQKAAFGLYDDKNVWDAYNNLFDLAKEYGVKPETMFELVAYGWGIEQLEDVRENAYQGHYDGYAPLRDFAHYLVDDELLAENQYEYYFDERHFGKELKWDFDLEMLVEDYGYDVAEAEDLLEGSDESFAEWYIDILGGEISELGMETVKSYFDFQKLERSLEAEGYLEIDGHIFRPY